MSDERLSFDLRLYGPEHGDDEWAATCKGLEAYGDSAAEAVGALAEQLERIVEDAEFQRNADPRVYGHTTGRKVLEVQRLHHTEVPQRGGSQSPATLHPHHQKEDRVQPQGNPKVARPRGGE